MPEKDLIVPSMQAEIGEEIPTMQTTTEAETNMEGGTAPAPTMQTTTEAETNMEGGTAPSPDDGEMKPEVEEETLSMETEIGEETQTAGGTAPMEGGTAPAPELLAHPMFYPFAKGREGSLTELCRDFAEMLRAGGISVTPRMTASVSARITPDSAYAVSDVALSERQRALARAAGMTYREYYELSCGIPNSIQKQKT